MKIIIYVVAGLFFLISMALFFAHGRTRHPGLLLMGITYGGSAVLAILLMHWWPLVVGFVLVWVLRMLGLEPGSKEQ
ncbi:MAG: hypothetical protein FJY54_13720 [Betaproteobacteria bacterium]|nr:hypothetical protein [Betaproteobacteria bacterium]